MFHTGGQCPTHEELFAYSNGKVDQVSSREIELHIDDCHECISQLDEINSSPEIRKLAEDLRNAADYVSSFKNDIHYQEAVSQSRKLLPKALPKFLFSSNSRFSDFHLIREIARGGMGIVYEAEQISLKRRVAIKILPITFFSGIIQKKRFEIESQAVAMLQHDNIIPIFHSGEESGNPFFVMPFIEGINLQQFMLTQKSTAEFSNDSRVNVIHEQPILDEDCVETVSFVSTDDVIQSKGADGSFAVDLDDTNKPLHTVTKEFHLDTSDNYYDTVAKFGMQAASALHHAHNMGIIHRDVKPSNLMINNYGHLWVMDFGLARINSLDSESITRVTCSGEVMGTIRYMSPEQASGRKELVNHLTDVYSLGVTLYELATLTPIFSSPNNAVLLQKVINEDPVAPRKINPEIPKVLETIILKATSKDMDDRYRSAGELEDDLFRMINNLPIHAVRPSVLDRLTRWSKRQKALSITLISALLFTTVLSVMFLLIFSSKNVALTNLNTKYEKSLLKTIIAQNRSRKLLENTRESNYILTMKRAGEAANKNDSIRGTRLLDSQLPKPGESDIRGLEWYVVKNQLQDYLKEVNLSTYPLYAVAINEKNRLIAAAGAEAKLYLLDADRLELLRTISTGQLEINGLEFFRDGKRVITSGDDGTVHVWNVLTGKNELRKLIYPRIEEDLIQKRVLIVKLTPDEKFMVQSANDNVINIWDVTTGSRVGEFQGHKEIANIFDISSDGKQLVSGSFDKTVRLWDFQTRKEIQKIKLPARVIGTAHVMGLAFSEDSRTVAIGTKDHAVYLWDLNSNQLKLAGFHDDPVMSLEFSDDESNLVALDRSGAVKLWDIKKDLKPVKKDEPAEKLVPVYSKLIHEGRIYDGTIDSVNKALLTVGEDGNLKQTVYRHREQKLNQDFTLFGNVEGLAWTQTKDKIAFFNSENLYLCRITRDGYELLWKAPSEGFELYSICFNSFGNGIYTGTAKGDIHFWDFRGNKPVKSWKVAKGQPISEVAICHKNHCLAFCIDEHVIRFLDLRMSEGGKTHLLTGNLSELKGKMVKFSPSYNRFAYCNQNTIHLMILSTGKCFQSFSDHNDGINCFNFTSDGNRLVVADNDRSIHIWDINDGTKITVPWKHDSDVNSIELTPDEKTLISSDKDGRITFWNYQQGQPLHSIQSHYNWSVLLLSSGRLLTFGLHGNHTLEMYDFGEDWNERYRNHIINR